MQTGVRVLQQSKCQAETKYCCSSGGGKGDHRESSEEVREEPSLSEWEGVERRGWRKDKAPEEQPEQRQEACQGLTHHGAGAVGRGEMARQGSSHSERNSPFLTGSLMSAHCPNPVKGFSGRTGCPRPGRGCGSKDGKRDTL